MPSATRVTAVARAASSVSAVSAARVSSCAAKASASWAVMASIFCTRTAVEQCVEILEAAGVPPTSRQTRSIS